MKRDEIKQKLARELPYPQLSIEADSRIDMVLSALPDRAPAMAGEGQTSLFVPDREDVTYVEAQKRRPAFTICKWAAACAVVVLLGLCCLNWASPVTTENLPVVGGVFQAANGWFAGDPDPTPAPVNSQAADFSAVAYSDLPIEDNETGLPADGTTLLSAEVVSDDGIPQQWSLVCTAKLPYLGVASWNLLEYDPNNWTADGAEATLHFPDGVFTFYGRRSFAGDIGKELTVTWEFGIDPQYLDGPVVLSIPERNWFAENEDGSVDRRVVAEFTIDLSSRKADNTGSVKAAVTDYYKTGYFGGTQSLQKVTPKEALEAPRNGEFTNGWYAQKPVIVPAEQRQDGGSVSGYKVSFFQEKINTEGLGAETGVYRHPDWDSVTLNYYVDEGTGWSVAGSIPACSRTELEKSGVEYSVTDGVFADENCGNAKVYHTVDGDFLDVLADRELAGGDYRRLSFFIPASALNSDGGEYFNQLYQWESVRLELVDSDGNVIFADAAGAAETEREQMAGAYHTICTMAPMGSYNCEPDPATHHPEEHYDDPLPDCTPAATHHPDGHHDAVVSPDASVKTCPNPNCTGTCPNPDCPVSCPSSGDCPNPDCTPGPHHYGNGNGTGNGYGNGNGNGSGNGYGYGNGNGTGNGYGYGDGMCAGYPTPDPNQYGGTPADSASSRPYAMCAGYPTPDPNQYGGGAHHGDRHH